MNKNILERSLIITSLLATQPFIETGLPPDFFTNIACRVVNAERFAIGETPLTCDMDIVDGSTLVVSGRNCDGKPNIYLFNGSKWEHPQTMDFLVDYIPGSDIFDLVDPFNGQVVDKISLSELLSLQY